MAPRPERTIWCPVEGCGHERRTKARRNTLVVCAACGGTYRVPAPDPADEADEEPDPAPVVDLEPVRIRQTARPRERGKPAPAAPDPAPAIAREPVDPTTLAPPHQERSRQAGRRGGLSRYKELTARG